MIQSFFLQWLLQKEGELVTTPSGVLHWGINISPNVHEAWNCTSRLWHKQDMDKSYCDCGTLPNPPRLAYAGQEEGVYMAKLIQGMIKLAVYPFRSA